MIKEAQLASLKDELEKIAIFQETFSTPEAELERRVPRVGGQSTKHLADNIRRKFGKRAPQLTERMLAATEAMGRVNPDAVDIPIAKTTTDHRYKYLKSPPNPKYKILFHPGQGSSANHDSDTGRARVHLDTTRPSTAAHEMGHVRDAYAGMDFGKRGFFGFGGDARSMVPSETSATRWAHAAGVGDPDITAATGTYMQSAMPNTMGKLTREYAEALKRGDPQLAQAFSAATKRNQGFQERIKALREQGGNYEFWKPIADKLTDERKGVWDRQLKALTARRSRAKWGTPEYETLSKRIDDHFKTRPSWFYGADERMREHLTPELQKKLDTSVLARKFGDMISKRETRLDEVVHQATNPASNRTVLHNLSPRATRTMGRVSKGLGNRLNKTVGPGLGQAAAQLAEKRLMAAPSFTAKAPVRPGGIPIVPKLKGALAAMPKLGSISHGFFDEMQKIASIDHAVELAGLGILAKPSVDELRGKKVEEKSKARWELAGLATLAAPSAYKLGKKFFTKRANAPVVSLNTGRSQVLSGMMKKLPTAAPKPVQQMVPDSKAAFDMLSKIKAMKTGYGK